MFIRSTLTMEMTGRLLIMSLEFGLNAAATTRGQLYEIYYNTRALANNISQRRFLRTGNKPVLHCLSACQIRETCTSVNLDLEGNCELLLSQINDFHHEPQVTSYLEQNGIYSINNETMIQKPKVKVEDGLKIVETPTDNPINYLITSTTASVTTGKAENEGDRFGDFMSEYQIVYEDGRVSRYGLERDFMDWETARKNCLEKHADLVSVETNLEQIRLMKWLRAESKFKPRSNVYDNSFWMSLNDRDVHGKLVWAATNNTLGTGFANWALGEPNDHDGDEDCCAFSVVAFGKWYDRPCGEKGRSVCEMVIQAPSTNLA